MYDHELKTFIQAILTDTISPRQLLEGLIHTIDWTKIYESENQLTTDAFFALKHYATGEEDISDIEWTYFINCLDGKCQYNMDQKMKIIMDSAVGCIPR